MDNITFEDIKVKLPELRIWVQDREIYPSLQDLRLLMIFLSDPYKTFGSKELVTLVDLPSKPALWTQICRVRKMLGDEKKYIHAVPGWGYTFTRR